MCGSAKPIRAVRLRHYPQYYSQSKSYFEQLKIAIVFRGFESHCD